MLDVSVACSTKTLSAIGTHATRIISQTSWTWARNSGAAGHLHVGSPPQGTTTLRKRTPAKPAVSSFADQKGLLRATPRPLCFSGLDLHFWTVRHLSSLSDGASQFGARTPPVYVFLSSPDWPVRCRSPPRNRSIRRSPERTKRGTSTVLSGCAAAPANR